MIINIARIKYISEIKGQKKEQAFAIMASSGSIEPDIHNTVAFYTYVYVEVNMTNV